MIRRGIERITSVLIRHISHDVEGDWPPVDYEIRLFDAQHMRSRYGTYRFSTNYVPAVLLDQQAGARLRQFT
eukprot:scaffold2130_cov402-Prasinococcus_capsulatus_cf.AAC.9